MQPASVFGGGNNPPEASYGIATAEAEVMRAANATAMENCMVAKEGLYMRQID